jgi:DNA-binding GntR family transcriptional regulator
MESQTTSFAPVQDSNLREGLATTIREAILTGRLQPGDRVVESRLAREMRVSQNAVREALIVLEHQGLVTRVANKGAFVTKLSSEAMEQIYLVRLELEGMAVRFAKQHMRLADVDELQKFIDDLRAAAHRKDPVTFCRVDYGFHQRLWECSGNPYLVKALASIVAPQFSYLLIESLRLPHADELLALTEEHQQMLDLIKNESAEVAAEGVKRIIQRFHDFAKPGLRQIEQRNSRAHGVQKYGKL